MNERHFTFWQAMLIVFGGMVAANFVLAWLLGWV